jgi:hypothetical protein
LSAPDNFGSLRRIKQAASGEAALAVDPTTWGYTVLLAHF